MTNLPYIILDHIESNVQIKKGFAQKTLLTETFLDEIVEILMNHSGGYEDFIVDPIQIFYVENNQWQIFEYAQYEEVIDQKYKKICLELYGQTKDMNIKKLIHR